MTGHNVPVSAQTEQVILLCNLKQTIKPVFLSATSTVAVFVCPSFALLFAPFPFTIAKKPLFSIVAIVFLFALHLPSEPFVSILKSYGAPSQNQVQNLFSAGCLLVVLLVILKLTNSPNHFSARLSGRILLVNLLVVRWSFCWSVTSMLALQFVTVQGFPLVVRWSFRWSLVCYSFVILFVSHRPDCSSNPCDIRLSGNILFVNPFVGHSFCHAKHPICVTSFQRCGSYGAQS